MCLSAHPGDEDAETLAFYRKKYGTRTYTVFYTRGEGGENLVGSELYKELGVLRTREAENAARILDTAPYFLNLIDFGPSRTATETLQKWGGKDSVLAHVVYIIRKLKPDVLITHQTSALHDGLSYGKQQAVALSALNAFEKAADINYHPEQFKELDVKPWRVKKLFSRIPGDSATEPETYDVAISVGEKGRIADISYVDIGDSARREYKSLGAQQRIVPAGTNQKAYYRLIKSDLKYGKGSNDFFSGVVLTHPDCSTLQKKILALSRMSPGNHTPMLEKLVETITEIDVRLGKMNVLFKKINDIFEYRLLIAWKKELEALRNQLLGVHVFFKMSDSVGVPGQVFYFTIDSISGLTQGITRLYFPNVRTGWLVLNDIKNEGSLEYKPKEQISIIVGKNQALTLPKSEKQYLSNSTEKTFRFFVVHQAKDGMHSFNLYQEVLFEIGPRVVFEVSPEIAKVDHRQTFEVKITDYLNDPAGDSVFVSSQGLGKAEMVEIRVAKKYDVGIAHLMFNFSSNTANGTHKLVFDLGNRHIITDTVVVKKFPVEVASGLKIGMLKGPSNITCFALDQFGIEYDILQSKNLSDGDLSIYSTIVVDTRAYSTREDLRLRNSRLLEYVKNGGSLVVMRQNASEWKPEYAPFPMRLTAEGIADETAPVKILQPEHPLFTFPNKIADNDWKDWVQERGLCFPGEHSKDYVELLSSGDLGEPSLRTGYLVANCGKGTYIYTSYSWHRQLKEVNPGAFRILANMISLPRYIR
jgi:LmbE family N-acetylglucosaminyl deacetylase